MGKSGFPPRPPTSLTLKLRFFPFPYCGPVYTPSTLLHPLQPSSLHSRHTIAAKMSSAIRRILPKPVANTGSQQRDHHANERTFLSWTRAGLGFAAMALALDRLDAIDRLLTSKLPSLASASPSVAPAQSQSHSFTPANTTTATTTNPNPFHNGNANGNGNGVSAIQAHTTMNIPGVQKAFSASKVCQLLGLWSLGYGFFRYWSMRQYLLRGQFVPAFWGPVFMTAGSFVAFMTLGLQMDRRHHMNHS